MTATPPSFAKTPDGAGQARDLLADMLRAVRLTGSVYMNARLTEPFGVVTPPQFDETKPLAHLRHISIFHLIASGRCTVELPGEEPRAVAAGDVLLVPFAGPHKIWNGEVFEEVSAAGLVKPGPIDGMWKINHGGGGETTRIVCGFIESSEFLFAPVFRSLPALMIYRSHNEPVGAVITSTVNQILDLADQAAPGADLMLSHLMQLLFVEVLRRHASDESDKGQGLFSALGDPLISRALQSVHQDPSRRWTVDDLAREAGTSRTVLADRFRAMMGQTPMDYVASWRMQIASGRLRDGQESIGAIAADVGYESEAAFNRAFKRVTGTTPGRWRSESKDMSGKIMLPA
ncbi:transcriptional regulator [Terrihabitans soli]|uniref:Transcriptional regulator n=1 Tax=Terrihabitans soli TaxID=708113 RepID=A0A6S6QV44_9HYPH|nr:AraC family transcriptional regulator [Terrihabitans soli]BCJ90378.1 transcriptional regulator [Terrihabitans soli]